MKKNYFLAGLIFVLTLGTFGYVVYYRCLSAASSLNATYLGACSRCNCLYEILRDQISIIRQGGSAICLICSSCRKMR